jgi:hypothetical protein
MLFIYIKICFHQNKTKNTLIRKESFGLRYIFFLLTSNDLNFNELNFNEYLFEFSFSQKTCYKKRLNFAKYVIN